MRELAIDTAAPQSAARPSRRWRWRWVILCFIWLCAVNGSAAYAIFKHGCGHAMTGGPSLKLGPSRTIGRVAVYSRWSAADIEFAAEFGELYGESDGFCGFSTPKPNGAEQRWYRNTVGPSPEEIAFAAQGGVVVERADGLREGRAIWWHIIALSAALLSAVSLPVWFTGVWTWSACRRRFARKAGLCNNCRYDLRGSTGSFRCPECGEPINLYC